jgi:hypothetical protein
LVHPIVTDGLALPVPSQGSLEVTQKPVAEQLLANPGAPTFP